MSNDPDDTDDETQDDTTEPNDEESTQPPQNDNVGQGESVQQEQPQHDYQEEPQETYQQQPAQTGPSVSDIFSRQDTIAEMREGLILMALLGVGIGLGMFGVTNSVSTSGGAGTGFAAAISVISLLPLPLAVGVIGTMFLAKQQNEALAAVPSKLVYATIGATGFGGTVVLFFIAWFFTGIGTGNVSFDGVLGPMLFGALGAGIAGAGIVWADRRSERSGSEMSEQRTPQ